MINQKFLNVQSLLESINKNLKELKKIEKQHSQILNIFQFEYVKNLVQQRYRRKQLDNYLNGQELQNFQEYEYYTLEGDWGNMILEQIKKIISKDFYINMIFNNRNCSNIILENFLYLQIQIDENNQSTIFFELMRAAIKFLLPENHFLLNYIYREYVLQKLESLLCLRTTLEECYTFYISKNIDTKILFQHFLNRLRDNITGSTIEYFFYCLLYQNKDDISQKEENILKEIIFDTIMYTSENLLIILKSSLKIPSKHQNNQFFTQFFYNLKKGFYYYFSSNISLKKYFQCLNILSNFTKKNMILDWFMIEKQKVNSLLDFFIDQMKEQQFEELRQKIDIVDYDLILFKKTLKQQKIQYQTYKGYLNCNLQNLQYFNDVQNLFDIPHIYLKHIYEEYYFKMQFEQKFFQKALTNLNEEFVYQTLIENRKIQLFVEFLVNIEYNKTIGMIDKIICKKEKYFHIVFTIEKSNLKIIDFVITYQQNQEMNFSVEQDNDLYIFRQKYCVTIEQFIEVIREKQLWYYSLNNKILKEKIKNTFFNLYEYIYQYLYIFELSQNNQIEFSNIVNLIEEYFFQQIYLRIENQNVHSKKFQFKIELQNYVQDFPNPNYIELEAILKTNNDFFGFS